MTGRALARRRDVSHAPEQLASIAVRLSLIAAEQPILDMDLPVIVSERGCTAVYARIGTAFPKLSLGCPSV